MTEKPSFVNRLDRLSQKLHGLAARKPAAPKEPARFASFQDRLMASVIDMAVVYLLLQDVFRFIMVRVYRLADVEKLQAALDARPMDATPTQAIRYQVQSFFDTGLFELWLINSLVQSLLIGVLLVLVWREFHCTLGKYLIGLEFAGKHGEGKPTTRDYMKRFAGFYLSMPPLMIGFALLGLDKEKRAWHDRVAGTTVVYAARGSIFRQIWNLLKAQIKREK